MKGGELSTKSFMEKIHEFIKSDFYFFIKYYLYFIILFSIIFYILLYINHNTTNGIVIVETKVFFYIGIFFLFLIINDILDTPLESLKQFLLIIMISLIFVYIVNYLIEYYYKDKRFFHKILIAISLTLVIFILTVIYIYFTFEKNTKDIASKIFSAFNYGVNKNLNFLIFLTIYLYIYKHYFDAYNLNTNLTDILSSSILGIMLIFFIFCLIIYVCLKLKIINRVQVLNSFIALSAIFIYLSLICIKIFMSSLTTICTTSETESSQHEQEKVILLILGSIFAVLWLDDTRNWHQIGSIIFVIITLFTFFCLFYYAKIHPGTWLLSLWLFIEWLILIFYKKENSKNSLHYSFMKT